MTLFDFSNIRIKNTCKTSWTKAEGFKLGSQNPRENTIWGLKFIDLSNDEKIDPGQEKTFSFEITAPSAAGKYNFRWRMMQEGVSWFGYLTENLVIEITGLSH